MAAGEKMSGTGNALGITRLKEGIPQWDGNASTYQEYEELCELWEATIPYHKRYMNGPKLAAELQGAAKRLILGKPVVQTLLGHLRACLGKPQLTELSDSLTRYFRQSRRKLGESMADYVTRKCELYLRAQQALTRVGANRKTGTGGMRTSGPPDTSWRAWSSSSTTEWSPWWSDRRNSGETPPSQASQETTESQAAAPVSASDGPSAETADAAEDESVPDST